MSDLVAARVLAPLYGVTAETISVWAKEGKIPTAVITPGGHRRFRIADVLEAAPIEGAQPSEVGA